MPNSKSDRAHTANRIRVIRMPQFTGPPATEAKRGLYRDFGLARQSFEQVARHATGDRAALYGRRSAIEEWLIADQQQLRTPHRPSPTRLASGRLREPPQRSRLTA